MISLGNALCALVALSPAVARAETQLTLDRVLGSPDLSGPTPRGLQLAPNGALATLIKARPSDRDRFDLWALDTRTGATRMLVDSERFGGGEVSEEEKMRRERARLSGARGVLSYEWAPDAKSLLVPLDGDLYRATLDGRVERLTETSETELDAQISKTGRYASFIVDQDLHVLDLHNRARRALTTDGAGDVSWGSAEFVAQEEMDRTEGHWWSPDDTQLVVARVDEAKVATVKRAAIGAEGTTTFEQKYPRAGTPNAQVDLYVFRLDAPTGAAPVRLDLGAQRDDYVARVSWTAKGDAVWVQRQSRDQRTLDLLACTPSTGACRVRLTENARTWVNLTSDLRSMASGRLLWTSERSGHRHVYAVERDGALTPLTQGAWDVAGVVGVDEVRGKVYLTGAVEDVRERHLYVVDLPKPGGAAKAPQRLTQPGAWHDVSMDKSATRALVTRSTPTQPPQTYLADVSGRRVAWVEENRVEGDHPYAPFKAQHIEPEFGVLNAEDGTPLHYAHWRPRLKAGERAPVLVMVYGGPAVGQMVTRRWAGPMRQYWTQRGWHVFSLDNRGTGGRGKAFEDAIHRALGTVEVRDQLAGAEWLASRPDVDATRIAVQGWSYGGYMVLKLLQAAPGRFAAGVAGAPVTGWGLYDTHYTERYLGDPSKDRAPYDRADVTPNADKIADPVLIVHGMADDNVVFENTTALVAKMQQAGQLFEVMVYPGQTHRIAGPVLGLHLWRTTEDFLARRLSLGAR